MINRTAALLVVAIGAWGVGGLIAVEEHWHPFGHDHWDSHADIRAYLPGTVLHDGELEVRLTKAERAMLPPGYPVDRAERALSAMLSRELDQRVVPHRLHDPAATAVIISDQLVGVRPRAISEFDPMLLWPMVAARLEASGQLPPHLRTRGHRVEIRSMPARRSTP